MWPIASVCAVAATLVGCSGGVGIPLGIDRTFTGPAQNIGSGVARSFVTLSSAGNPTAIGLTFTQQALSNLPIAPDTMFLLPLPSQGAATVFNHISLDWESQGHVPVPIFGTPHFDMHFYLISQAERNTIGFAPDEPAPAPAAIPSGYVSTHTVVPQMGQHWIDPTDPNTTPGNFQHTLIYGFHSEKMVFVEPMITRAFLLTKADFSGAIKQPTVYPKPGFYPTHYSVKFNPGDQTYTVTLDQLVQR